MESSLLLVGAALVLAVLLKWVLETRRKKPPGPWNLPIVGYVPFLSHLPHLDLQRLSRKYGNVYSIRMGSNYVVVLNDFQSTKDAFSQDAFIGRPPDAPFDLNKETKETEAMNGLPWKEQRRFSLHMLKDLGFGKSRMEEHIQDEIAELLEHYSENAGRGRSFLVRDLLTTSMVNNIGSLMFGRRLKYGDPVRQMMVNVVNTIGKEAAQVSWQVFFPWLKNVLKFLGIGHLDKISGIADNLKIYIMKEINEHEATLNPNNIRDFIDGYLLEIEKRKNDPSFSKPVLADLVVGFLGAGSETVRLSVEWLVLTVASHQDAQRRIQAEIDEVVGRNRLPEGSDQKSMPYTEAFILELTRWRTIIPLNILRYTLVDSEVNGYFIPKHTHVLSNLWAIHHDPTYWGSDVEEFRPERFLSEDGKTVKKWEHFIPFSIGKRACPGEPFARVEVFLYFTSILQRFDVRLPPGKVADFEGELGIGLQPKAQEVIMAARN